jgi:hypothetical protein
MRAINWPLVALIIAINMAVATMALAWLGPGWTHLALMAGWGVLIGIVTKLLGASVTR